MDKEEVRRTKKFLKCVLEANSTNPKILKSFPGGRSLGMQDLREVLGQLGHKVTDNQIDVMMFYLNPYHDGKISKSNIEKATRNIDRFENDRVTADLRDGVSVVSSQLGSLPSVGSRFEIDQLARVKDSLQEIAVNGKVREDDFRKVVCSELDQLPKEQLDLVVQQAFKVTNNPNKIFDSVLPKAISCNVKISLF